MIDRFREILSNEKRWLFFIFFLALLIRLIVVLSINSSPLGDAYEFDRLAQRLLSGENYIDASGRVSFYAPFYPFFLASIYSIFGHKYLVVRIIQAFIWSVSLFFIYLISKKVFNGKVGLLASFISALYPPFIYHHSGGGGPYNMGPGFLVSENLFIPLLLVSTLLVLNLENKPIFNKKVFLGILLGVTTLTRPVLIFLPLVFCYWLWMNLKRKEALMSALIIIISFILTLMPWTIRNYAIHKAFIPVSTTGAELFYQSNHPEARGLYCLGVYPAISGFRNLSEVEQSRMLYREGMYFLKENTKLFKLLFRKLLNFWDISINDNYNFAYGIILPFSLLGIVISVKNRNYHKRMLLILLILYFLLMTLVFSGSVRFRLPLEPYLIIFASFALWYISKKFSNKILLGLFVLLLIFANILLYLNYSLFFKKVSNLLKFLGLH